MERQAKELVKLGHEVTVFAPEYDGELPEGEDHFDENGIQDLALSDIGEMYGERDGLSETDLKRDHKSV